MSLGMRMARVGVALVALACSSNDAAPAVGQGGITAAGGTSTATAGGGASATGGGGASAAEGGKAGVSGASGSSWLDVPGTWSEPQLLDKVGVGGALWAARNEDGSILAIWRPGMANEHRFSLFRDGAWSPVQVFETGSAATDPRLAIRIVPSTAGSYYVQLNDIIVPFADGAWQPALELPEVQAFDVDDAGRMLVAFLKAPPAGSTYMQLYVGFQDDLPGAFLFEGVKLPAGVAVRALPGGQWLAASNGSYRSFDGAAWSDAAGLSAPIDRDQASFGSDGRLWTTYGYDVWTYLLAGGFQQSAKLGEVDDSAERQVVPIAAERGVVMYTSSDGEPYLSVAAGEVGLSGTVSDVVEVGKGARMRGTSDLKGGAHFTYEAPAGIHTQRYLANEGWSRPVLLLPRGVAMAFTSVSFVFPDPDGSAAFIARAPDNTITTARFTPQ